MFSPVSVRESTRFSKGTVQPEISTNIIIANIPCRTDWVTSRIFTPTAAHSVETFAYFITLFGFNQENFSIIIIYSGKKTENCVIIDV